MDDKSPITPKMTEELNEQILAQLVNLSESASGRHADYFRRQGKGFITGLLQDAKDFEEEHNIPLYEALKYYQMSHGMFTKEDSIAWKLRENKNGFKDWAQKFIEIKMTAVDASEDLTASDMRNIMSLCTIFTEGKITAEDIVRIEEMIPDTKILIEQTLREIGQKVANREKGFFIDIPKGFMGSFEGAARIKINGTPVPTALGMAYEALQGLQQKNSSASQGLLGLLTSIYRIFSGDGLRGILCSDRSEIRNYFSNIARRMQTHQSNLGGNLSQVAAHLKQQKALTQHSSSSSPDSVAGQMTLGGVIQSDQERKRDEKAAGGKQSKEVGGPPRPGGGSSSSGS